MEMVKLLNNVMPRNHLDVFHGTAQKSAMIWQTIDFLDARSP